MLGLQSLDLSPLRSVTRIGDEFLGGCSNLTSIDLRVLCNVRRIGGRCLYDSLRSDMIASIVDTVRTMGEVCWEDIVDSGIGIV